MGIETRSKEIDGSTYTVAQLPAMRGLKLLNRIGRSVGPPLTALMGAADPMATVAQMEIGSIAPAARELFDRLTESELESIIKALCETVQVTEDGKTMPLLPVFDLHFAGRYDKLFHVVWFAMEVNYGDFFGDLAGKLAGLGNRPSPTAASNTSPPPGPAGASS
jgi:hypothetical protein